MFAKPPDTVVSSSALHDLCTEILPYPTIFLMCFLIQLPPEYQGEGV